jgi:sugar lactone lactonase YvrE
VGPGGFDILDYDAQGNFYVVNTGASNILKYPNGVGPPIIFADIFDGVSGAGEIAVAPNGDVYTTGIAPGNQYTILRFSPEGIGEVFDTIAVSPDDLEIDSDGNLYLLSGGLLRYTAGDPDSQQLIAGPLGGAGATSMVLAPDEQSMYVAFFGQLHSVDLTTAVVTTLTPQISGFVFGNGIAVYVPEPATLILVTIGALIARWRAR